MNDLIRIFDKVHQNEEKYLHDPTVELIQIEFSPSFSTSTKDHIFVTILQKRDSKPKANILCLHGIDGFGQFWAKYCGTDFLNANYRLVIPDLPSHGRTANIFNPDSFGFIQDIGIFARVVDCIRNELLIKLETESDHHYLMGCSLGGMHIINYLHDHGDKNLFHGAIFVSPAFELSDDTKPSVFLEYTVRSLLYMLPFLARWRTPTPGIAGNICPDPNFEIDFRKDPLNFTDGIKMGTGLQIMDSMQKIPDRIHNISLPVLALHGSGDRCTSHHATIALIEKASATDKTLKIYDKLEHILFHEDSQITSHIIDWVEERCKL